MAKRGRKPQGQAELSNSMLEMGYMAVIPGLDLAINELHKLRDSIAALLPSPRYSQGYIAAELSAPRPEPPSEEPLPVLHLNQIEDEAPRAEPAPARKTKTNRALNTSNAVRYRWHVVKEAGLQVPKGGGSPNRALVAKAERILARREGLGKGGRNKTE